MTGCSKFTNGRKELSKFFPFFVYLYFFLYIVSLVFILSRGNLLSHLMVFSLLLFFAFIYKARRKTIFSKINKLYKFFILISVFKIFQERSGQLVFDYGIGEIYEDGLQAFIFLFIKLCSLALNAFLFIEVSGEENISKFVRFVFLPFEKVGLGNGQDMSILLMKAYDVFPLVFSVLKKGIKKGMSWIQDELKLIMLTNNKNDKEQYRCNKKFMFMHALLLLLVPIYFFCIVFVIV